MCACNGVYGISNRYVYATVTFGALSIVGSMCVLAVGFVRPQQGPPVPPRPHPGRHVRGKPGLFGRQHHPVQPDRCRRQRPVHRSRSQRSVPAKSCGWAASLPWLCSRCSSQWRRSCRSGRARSRCKSRCRGATSSPVAGHLTQSLAYWVSYQVLLQLLYHFRRVWYSS